MTSEIKQEAARDAAMLLREAWGAPLPVDPISIARAAGIRVLDAPLDDDTAGALVKEPGQDPTILLNQNDSPNRKRFTCAHELGHYRRRSADETEYTTVDLRGSLAAAGTDPEEIYANEFAASLLMPEDAVRRLLEEGLGDLELAIRFGVSREAIEYRLKNLFIPS
ncbi:MAG: ImmA/IrrE family metallo-endopeptidase [Solirubrobacteraceae bacterium]